MNRRQFVAAAAGLSLAAFDARCAHATSAPAVQPAPAAAAAFPNPFYAMDTSFQRPGLTPDEQLDLVKELGFAGVAWTHDSCEKDKASLGAVEKRGLRMFAIYCGGKVTPTGALTLPPDLPQLMTTLKDHGTIIWIHLGGLGPAFEGLTGTDAIVSSLRLLADAAGASDLRVAVYPHLGEWTAHFADATRLAQIVNHPRFGVTFNLCHALAVGDEAKIAAMLEQAKDRLFTATICGADAGVTGGRWDRLIQTLDKGSFDVTAVLRKLHRIGFTGPVGFQGYAVNGDARSILTPTMNAWRKLSVAAVATSD